MSETGGARREARGEDEGRGADERLNLAIDLTVRQMLDVEPPPGLRDRVLQRVSDSDRQVSSGFSRRILWTALPVAAAAMIILALLPTRTPEPARPTTVAGVEPGKAAPANASDVRQGPTASAIVATRPGVARSQRPAVASTLDRTVAAATFQAPAEGTTTIASLEAIDPILVAPIAEHRIAPADIVVRPLNEITEVQIAPLSPPERRN